MLSKGLTNIKSYAFEGTNLSKIIIPATVTSIDEYAFLDCKNLRDILIYPGVSSIGEKAIGYRLIERYDQEYDECFYEKVGGVVISGYIGSEAERYANENGFTFIKKTGWVKLADKWYYYGKNGALKKCWKKISDKWYYFDASGAMTTGWKKISGKWYYFTTAGKMVTGWQKISRKWYYFTSGGIMITGWKNLGGKWYYFSSSGDMTRGWKKISSKWYYFSSSGEMITGWKKISGKWYWFDSNGAMFANGTKIINGKNYRFSDSGICLNP